MTGLTLRDVHVEITGTGFRVCGRAAFSYQGRVIEEGDYCTPEVSWEVAEATVGRALQDARAELHRDVPRWRRWWHRLTGKGSA